ADPQDAADTRELALRELDRMHRLADDLVLLAKSEAPDFVRKEPTDLAPLLDNVLDQARQLGRRYWRLTERVEAVVPLDQERVAQALLQLAANAVKVSEEGNTVRLGAALRDGAVARRVGDGGLGVPLDQERVTQALLQLAANAVKFSEEGNTVRLGAALRDGDVALWVEDEGIGIPPDQVDRVFDRFAQVTGPHGRPRSGSGLGLSIVAAIAAAHGGRVTVSSQVGRGSRFTLLLPAPGLRPSTLADDEVVVDPDEVTTELTDQDGARELHRS